MRGGGGGARVRLDDGGLVAKLGRPGTLCDTVPTRGDSVTQRHFIMCRAYIGTTLPLALYTCPYYSIPSYIAIYYI